MGYFRRNELSAFAIGAATAAIKALGEKLKEAVEYGRKQRERAECAEEKRDRFIAAHADAIKEAEHWKRRAESTRLDAIEDIQESVTFTEEVGRWIEEHREEVERITAERDEAKRENETIRRVSRLNAKHRDQWRSKAVESKDRIQAIREALEAYEGIDIKDPSEAERIPEAYNRLCAAIRGGQDAEGEGDKGGSVPIPEGTPEGGTVRTEE